MALISCPDCGKVVSDQAQSCPHCGYPIAARLRQQREEAGALVLQQTQQEIRAKQERAAEAGCLLQLGLLMSLLGVLLDIFFNFGAGDYLADLLLIVASIVNALCFIRASAIVRVSGKSGFNLAATILSIFGGILLPVAFILMLHKDFLDPRDMANAINVTYCLSVGLIVAMTLTTFFQKRTSSKNLKL